MIVSSDFYGTGEKLDYEKPSHSSAVSAHMQLLSIVILPLKAIFLQFVLPLKGDKKHAHVSDFDGCI